MDTPARARGNVPVRLYPWRSLDATSRERVFQVRQLGRAIASWIDVDAARTKLEALVGERISLRLRSLETERLGSGGPATQLHVAVVLGEEPTFSLDVEPALATRLLSGALGRAAPLGSQRPVLPAPFRAPEPEVAQAFAALILAASRAARAGEPASSAPLTVVAAGTVRSLLGTRSTEPSLAAVYVVTVGPGSGSSPQAEEIFLARLVAPRSLLERAARPSFDRSRLLSLGAMPLSLPLVAAFSTISPSELAELAVGDAWIPARWLPTFATPGKPAENVVGPVLLASPSAEEGVRAELTADGQLVLRGTTEPLPWTESIPAVAATDSAPPTSERSESDEMNDDNPGALLDSLADAPVVVRVEIGVAELRAREWAELAPGDVVGLGRRVAEPVILRVAGREVARGELVDLDGEVGVRILSRLEVG